MSHHSQTPTILPRRRGARVRVAGLALAALATMTVSACGGDDEEPVAEASAGAESVEGAAGEVAPRPGFGLVTGEQAAALAADPGVVVLDVRTPAEFAEGHIDGATLVDFEAPSFADEIAKLDPSADYLVYCRSGNRSGQAVAVMQSLGFENIWDLDGGVITWSGEGRPLVK
jgi:phage shock protein E